MGAEDAIEKGIGRSEWSDGGGRDLIGGRRCTGEERRANNVKSVWESHKESYFELYL